jgi:hypothetical protein
LPRREIGKKDLSDEALMNVAWKHADFEKHT